MGVMQQEK